MASLVSRFGDSFELVESIGNAECKNITTRRQKVCRTAEKSSMANYSSVCERDE